MQVDPAEFKCRWRWACGWTCGYIWDDDLWSCDRRRLLLKPVLLGRLALCSVQLLLHRDRSYGRNRIHFCLAAEVKRIAAAIRSISIPQELN